MARNSLMNINTEAAGFNPAAFEGSMFTPQFANNALLAQSLSQLEGRMEKAADKQSGVDVALAKIEDQLHNDEETKAWFNDYKTNIQNQIQEQISVGNFGRAIKVATRLGAQAAQDSQILGRIKANADYQKEMDRLQARVDKHEISQETYEWFTNKYHYKYEELKDGDNNIVGGKLVEPEERPVNTIHWAEIAKMAFDLKSPEKYSKSVLEAIGALTKDEEGNTVNNKKQEKSSKQYQRVLQKYILDNYDKLIETLPDGLRQVTQQWDVDNFQLDKLEDELKDLRANDPNNPRIGDLIFEIDKRKSLLFTNGNKDLKSYYAKNVLQNSFAKSLAYDWITETTSESDVTTPTKSGGSSVSGINPLPKATGTVTGAPVVRKSNTPQYVANANVKAERLCKAIEFVTNGNTNNTNNKTE